MSPMMKRALALLLLLFAAVTGAACAQHQGYSSLDELDGARIGAQTGTTEGKIVEERFPEATVTYFQNGADLTAALEKNKIDAFPLSIEVLRTIMAENDRVTYLSEPLSTYDCGFAFPKTERGDALRTQFDAFLRDIRADGTLRALDEKWNGGLDHPPVEYDTLPGPNGTLRMATDATYPPFEYVSNGRYAGLDVELAARFCEAYGYGLEVVDMTFDAVVASVPTGKCDFAGSSIEITQERAQSVSFSEPYYTAQTVMVVLKGEEDAGSAAVQPEITDFDGLSGKTVSMLTGAPFEEMIRDVAPDVGAFTTYNSGPDMLLALRSGKTDAALFNNAIAALTVNRDPTLCVFPQSLQESAFGIAFAKGDPRRDEWQAALDTIPQEDIQAAWDKWTGADETVKSLPPQDWPGENGTVRAAVCDTLEPLSYTGEGGGLMGFDLEVIQMLARVLDVHVEFTGMEFASVLSAVQAGKADIGAGSIIVTPERAESVDFVDYYPAAFVLIVRAAEGTGQTGGGSFWDSVVSSFEKTFLRENRWQLFLDGVQTTLIITVLSILFGTAIGFLVFMLCRNGNVVANAVTRFALWLVQGMPMVVLLMILYYIIFGRAAVSGLLVAVLGFTITFAGSVFGLLKMGVGAIDRGQYEAACALGYSDRRAFFRVILPQALPHILPAYRGEIVGLIKATAIVGYIAVQDLTKMGDIVRSRTYEAFFPLIAVTVIYFVLEGLLGFAVSRIGVGIDPRRRSRTSILKGVKTDD